MVETPVARLSRRASLVVFAVLLYVAAYLAFYSQYPADDAFIHLRIARNFAATGRPYFDPAEAVAASSSVLWTLIVGGLFRVFGPTVSTVVWAEIAAAMAMIALCAWLLRDRFSLPAAVLVAAGIIAAYVLYVGALLMDTPVAVLCLLLAMVCWRAGWYAALGVCSGMALLARYEAVLWLALTVVLLPDRVARRRFVAGAAGPLAFAVLFNVHYFGALIPNTVWAKSRVYRLTFAEFFNGAGLKGAKLGFFVTGCVLLVAEVVRRPHPGWVRAAALFPIILFALYAATRTLMFSWYWPLVFVPLAVACIVAVPNRMFYVPLLLLLATRGFWSDAIGEAYGVVTRNPSYFREFTLGARVQQYLRIGGDLAASSPAAVLMTSEIGGLGWTFPGKLIDAAGLVSPACLAFHPMAVPEERSKGSWGAIPVRAVQAFTPDLVVSMDQFSEAFRRAQSDGLLGEYVLVREYPVFGDADARLIGKDTLWHSRSIQVFARRH